MARQNSVAGCKRSHRVNCDLVESDHSRLPQVSEEPIFPSPELGSSIANPELISPVSPPSSSSSTYDIHLPEQLSFLSLPKNSAGWKSLNSYLLSNRSLLLNLFTIYDSMDEICYYFSLALHRLIFEFCNKDVVFISNPKVFKKREDKTLVQI
ncbi:hypothetical protein RCL1_006522 [Eukaryota sp. TZLM3-RCL]